jgi:aspartate/methionine/tyrosine aminotransferase
VFSTRIPIDLTPNRLSEALQQVTRDSGSLIDLTLSNPTHAGFDYPPGLLASLAHPRALTYRPQPLGLLAAREAIAADYARRAVVVPPQRIMLTASTSEAYSILFKVLCDAGDEVLVPRPSYPLFEHLARLDVVTAVPYELEYQRRWTLDIDSIERALTPRTKVVLAVSPNNPTGSYVTADELAAVFARCAPRQIAVIVDEVFADYELEPGAAAAAARPIDQSECLAFSLGGLSKSIGLPQAKLGWIAAGGPDSLAAEAINRVEFLCDTYLSVSTPVQAATADLLEAGAPVRTAIQARVAANYQVLRTLVAAVPACQVLAAEGGWYAVVQVPTFSTEEDLVLDLLVNAGVLVHPGYFFDFPRESFLIVSLLVPQARFVAGIGAILRHFDCTQVRPS